MGKEATCTARFKRQTSEGKLRLETDDLTFRGDFRLKIPLKQIESVSVSDGELKVRYPEGDARFLLGTAAPKWAEAISQPKTLLDKLGVKPGMTVSVLDVTDQDFIADLRSRVPDCAVDRPAKGSDLIFYQADEPKQLKKLEKFVPDLTPAGGIWVITPKRRPEIADTVVIAAGKAAGLVDVKVARFSELYTALKFVIPKAKR
jgi:hypothetical protein